jgi:alkylation response protein AidB-like acyl-CoA dehydrogenase
MIATESSFEHVLEQVASGVVAAEADTVDRHGAFPEKSIDALRSAGLLGAVSAPEVGGLGKGLRGGVTVVERVARECGSTAMVVCMHFSGTAVLEALGNLDVRREAAAGRHLSTLAFSEAASRSHFWVPTGTSARSGDRVRLDARKSWVTSANHATAYVWSSRPLESEGLSTLWLVPARLDGLEVAGGFDGLGLRGNDSSPVSANDVRVPLSAMLGEDGAGFATMMQTVLPMFSVCNAAVSVGLMRAAVENTARHVRETRHAHLDSSLSDLPTIRNYVARMQVKADSSRALLEDTLAAIETGRADATLRVLESKAAAGENSTEVLDLAMRVCGGAAFRKEVGVERLFRDVRAAGVMGPTTDVLYDFIGKAVCGMELF